MTNNQFANLNTAEARKAQLEEEFSKWFSAERDDWDELVTGQSAPKDLTSDLYDDMPVIDSKAVARAAPIFEKVFGIPFDSNLIKPGGYTSASEVVADIAPKMEQKLVDHEAKTRRIAK